MADWIANVTLTSKSPLVMHRDDVMSAELVKKWQKDPANKELSVPGDDRSPPWTWHTYLYHDGKHVALPADNLMACLTQAGAGVKLPKGKGSKSCKELVASSVRCLAEYAPLLVCGKQIAVAPIQAMHDADFDGQLAGASTAGIELLVKRMKVGRTKHVRVRPMFHEWSVGFRLKVTHEAMTPDLLATILDVASDVGLCDSRPSSNRPGPYGMFKAEISKAATTKAAA